MRRIHCKDCKTRMLVGDRLALCESCGKIMDLAAKKPGKYHHPLTVAMILLGILALVVAMAMT